MLTEIREKVPYFQKLFLSLLIAAAIIFLLFHMYLKPIWHQFINRYLQSLRHIKQRLYSHFDLSGFISGNGFVGATSSKFFSKSILRHVFLFANLLDLLTNKFRV